MTAPRLSIPSTIALVGLLVPLACQAPRGHEHDAVDAEIAAPAPLEGGSQAKSDEEMSAEKAKECGRGTGRDESGVCVRLPTQDAGYAQRLMIPRGEFIMGYIPINDYDASTSRQVPAVRWSGSPPRHVDSRAFWIDVAEVTVEAYEACVKKGDCTAAACPDGTQPSTSTLDAANRIRDQLPQTCVTHEQAETFCRANGGRLPTEAEWEFAARGVDARIYPWGNQLRDELIGGLVPVTRTRIDASYFGIFGMGSNAMEWVAEVYEADAGLRPYLGGEFRDPKGPLAETRAIFEARLTCGKDTCPKEIADPVRHVIKGSISGARYAAREKVPDFLPNQELEGWKNVSHDNDIGFRCAADLGEGDPDLKVPTPAPTIPLTVAGQGVELFGGVAEAVNRKEARRFCSALKVEVAGAMTEDWRLPTLEEVQAVARVFKGPGPFWTADGAAIKSEPSDDGEAEWVAEKAGDDEALAARCVRNQ